MLTRSDPPPVGRFVAKTADELAGATISSAMDTLPDLAAKVEKTRKPRPKARKPTGARRARARPIPGQAATAATPRPVAARAPAPGEAPPSTKATGAAATNPTPAARTPMPAGKSSKTTTPVKARDVTTPSSAGSGAGAGFGAAGKGASPQRPVGISGGARALGIGATAMAQATTASILDALPNVLPGEWAVRYRKSTTEAVHIRADGGASAKWPSGSRAVSVDVDRDPEGGADAKLYRMFVMSENGTMVSSRRRTGQRPHVGWLGGPLTFCPQRVRTDRQLRPAWHRPDLRSFGADDHQFLHRRKRFPLQRQGACNRTVERSWQGDARACAQRRRIGPAVCQPFRDPYPCARQRLLGRRLRRAVTICRGMVPVPRHPAQVCARAQSGVCHQRVSAARVCHLQQAQAHARVSQPPTCRAISCGSTKKVAISRRRQQQRCSDSRADPSGHPRSC